MSPGAWKAARGRGIAVGAVLLACGGCGGVADPPGPAASFEIIAGNDQVGKAGDQLQELVVRVTDDAGRGASGQEVIWTVASGAGLFSHTPSTILRPTKTTASTRTNEEGRTTVFLTPTVLGQTIVRARLARTLGPFANSELTFAVEATGLVIRVEQIDQSAFFCLSAPAELPCVHEVQVPVGTPVEWLVAGPTQSHINSTVEPPGGTPIRSPLLEEGGRFSFTPDVPGTWEYVDDINWAFGTLIAH